MSRPLFEPTAQCPTYVRLYNSKDEPEGEDTSQGGPPPWQPDGGAPKASEKGRNEARLADARFAPGENTFEEWLRASEKFDINALATPEEKEKLNLLVNGSRHGQCFSSFRARANLETLLVAAMLVALVSYVCHASSTSRPKPYSRQTVMSQRSAVEDLLGL